jgi:hypothetical protein
MKILFSLLSFILLLGCSGESTSQDRVTETKTEFKESKVLGLFGKKDEKDFVISSPIEGILLKDGKPLSNIKITRYLGWTGYEGEREDEFFTGDEGKFVIPAHIEALRLGALTQFYGNMLLVAEYNGEEVELWSSSKFNGEIYSDTDGPLKDLTCDINSLEAGLEMKYSTINTKCRWQGMPELN